MVLKMPFGYIPHRTLWKDIILRISGYPSAIRRIQAPVIMRMLGPEKGDIILDAGCGGGFFAYEIAKKCEISVGIDWKLNEGLSFATSKKPNVTYIKGDVQQLPFASGKFNKILLSSVLQMVKDDKSLLRECHRVLKENGLIALSVPIEYIYLKRLNELKPQLKEMFGSLGKGFYEYDEVMTLLAAEGFEIMEIEYAPKRWGSLVCDIGLYLRWRFGFPFFSPYLFPLLYPVVYFDRLAGRKQTGNELIIKARRSNNGTP